MPNIDAKVTTEMLWQAAILLGLIDVVFVPLLSACVAPSEFRQLKWPLALTAALFWGALWLWMVTAYWDAVYHYMFPEVLRWWLPLIYGLFYAVVIDVSWWLAVRVSRNAVAAFCLCGGVCGLLTHVWAVYRGIVSLPPMLQGASPVAAVGVAVVEFILYWCMILSAARLAGRVLHGTSGLHPRLARKA